MQKAYYQSSIGWLELTGSIMGIRSIKIIPEKQVGENSSLYILQKCIRQLDEYFNLKRKVFNVKLDWQGTTFFSQTVWRALLEIPYGHTTTYSAIAEKIGKSKAVRAVGMANHNNPIPIIVPCHRVLGKNGKLVGYFYGLDIKQKLLELENPKEFAHQGALF